MIGGLEQVGLDREKRAGYEGKRQEGGKIRKGGGHGGKGKLGRGKPWREKVRKEKGEGEEGREGNKLGKEKVIMGEGQKGKKAIHFKEPGREISGREKSGMKRKLAMEKSQ
jgi:hypothetical protein